VDAVLERVYVNFAGIGNGRKPMASFLFLGPTGTGKTELARLLSQHLDMKLLKYDMSEYQEKHTVSSLIGAPPGYVGFEDGNVGGGKLISDLSKHPFSIILFDEIEKAHKDIFSTLLQMLDDGHMTDGLGRKINFKNCLIIMTSNIGVKKVQDFGTGVGFKSSNNSDVVQEEYKRDVLKKELSKFFAPEFLNRIDDIVIFNSLKKEHIDQIVKLEIDKLVNRLSSMKYRVGYEASVVDLISKVGFDEQYGARPLKRAIQDKIEDLISEKILLNEVQEEKEYMLFVKTEGEDQVIGIECREKPEPKKRGRKKKED
jgi:ATP-dependent Clp protease ATP-binding subunit ClpC